MNDDVFQFVKGLLLKKGPIPGATREEQLAYRYLDTGHIDSLNLMQFILEIEDYFSIQLDTVDTESDEFRFIGGLVELIESKV